MYNQNSEAYIYTNKNQSHAMLYLLKHIVAHLFAFFQHSLEEKYAEETLRNDLQPARSV